MPTHAPRAFLSVVPTGLVLLLWSGCPTDPTHEFDFDGDGWDDEDDCEPDDPDVHPEADDPYGQGGDTNCDGVDGVDQDGDGFPEPDDQYGGDFADWDCNDADPAIHPGVTDDAVSNGIDNDCDGIPGIDADGDEHASVDSGGDDCDDTDPDVHPGALEQADCDDDDCDGLIDDGTATADDDGDGFCEGLDLGEGAQCCDGTEIGDCDDSQATFSPTATDIVGDGFDQNCDGIDGFDGDLDGYASDASGGDDCDDGNAALNHDDLDGDLFDTCADDCDDTDPDLYPDDLDGDGITPCDGDCDDGEIQVWPGNGETCDGLDNDCDPATDELVDGDGDGFADCDGDCDDDDPTSFPGGVEVCDAADNDCDGYVDENTGLDQDMDGINDCAGDCDELDATVYPGAPEICDGKDNDCDGLMGPGEDDLDGDGWPECAGADGRFDCDDTDEYVSPGAAELCNGLDDDCDGQVDDDCLVCTLTVPTDVAVIQDAIDASVDGEVICLEPGSYLEQIDYGGVYLTVVGLAGRALTVIDGDGAGPVVTLSVPSSDARLQGVTVQNGDAGEGLGGGILVSGSPTLTSVTVRDCLAGQGGGIYAYNTGGTWTNVIVADNEAPMLGDDGGRGGGAFLGASLPTCQRCAFLRNEAAWQGGGLFVESPSTPLSDTTVAYNSGGGGIHATGDVELDHVRVERNRDARGGGYLPAVSVVIRDSLFVHNSGSGITLFGGLADVRDSLFVSNVGIGLDVAQDTALTVERVLIADNTGAGAELMFAPPATFAHTVFRNNGGAAISATNDVDQVDVRDSVFEGNGGTVEADPGLCSLERIVFWDNVTDQTACDIDTLLAVEPQFGSTFSQDPLAWDLHLDPASPLIDAGSVVDPDPDGSPADIGLYGGPGAGDWDLDWDGYPEWWQPGDYDFVTYPGLGWDCDDRDATVYPGSGC